MKGRLVANWALVRNQLSMDDKLQTRIKLGDRTVYKSGRALKVIQSRLTTLVTSSLKQEAQTHSS